ncbi:TIGR02391 family protein [Burkholderia seminalis]|uniref:TIGR02391 family protein n=1 Tax=Burkholderia seminalis TaxID=488731 RepID=UPI0019062BB4|nr:TIGR02391 family protein [Burkholderia seminalis]MBJ9968627.1 TIGR02391 family protein [Burkholderia seminalis]
MRDLFDKFPDAELLLGLEPEELGAEILSLLKVRKEDATFKRDRFNPNSLRCELHPHPQVDRYPPQHTGEIQLAVAEAFRWLATQGLILPVPEKTGETSEFWCLSRRARRFTDKQAFTEHQTARLLPKQLLHPQLTTRVWLSFMRGVYETAVFEAMRDVEISVRAAGNFPQTVYGTQLMRDAFNPKNGPLTDSTLVAAEQEAMRDLFTGAIGSYKNPHSHRHAPIDGPRWAIEMILLASHLLFIVDTRVEANKATS